MLRIFRRADALPETNPGQEAVFVIVSNGWTTTKLWSPGRSILVHNRVPIIIITIRR